MNEVSITPEDQRKVSEIYNEYQRKNQEAHDEARRLIVEEYNITEEEAEGHPEMEDKFETLRAMASNGQRPNSSVLSVNPTTGEPGTPAPRLPTRPPVSPPAAAPQYSHPTNPLQLGEHLLTSQGFVIVESRNDYINGLITFVVKPQ